MKPFCDIAAQVSRCVEKGIEICLVSSGAIKSGRDLVENSNRRQFALSRKALAGVGAHPLLDRWTTAFKEHSQVIAQILVTYANWLDPNERESIRTSILEYMTVGIVPVINENDVVAQDEVLSMEKGISENDRLTRMTATLIGADGVLFLTDAGGVFDRDPSEAGAQKLDFVGPDDLASLKPCEGKSACGTGGILPKVGEASLCAKAGIRAAIAGLEPDVITRFAAGEHVGTIVVNE